MVVISQKRVVTPNLIKSQEVGVTAINNYTRKIWIFQGGICAWKTQSTITTHLSFNRVPASSIPMKVRRHFRLMIHLYASSLTMGVSCRRAIPIMALLRIRCSGLWMPSNGRLRHIPSWLSSMRHGSVILVQAKAIEVNHPGPSPYCLPCLSVSPIHVLRNWLPNVLFDPMTLSTLH